MKVTLAAVLLVCALDITRIVQCSHIVFQTQILGPGLYSFCTPPPQSLKKEGKKKFFKEEKNGVEWQCFLSPSPLYLKQCKNLHVVVSLFLRLFSSHSSNKNLCSFDDTLSICSPHVSRYGYQSWLILNNIWFQRVQPFPGKTSGQSHKRCLIIMIFFSPVS